MMDVGWKQSVDAFARVVLNVVLVLATLSRMGPKRERVDLEVRTAAAGAGRYFRA